jgi:hypothetical protein
MTWFRIDDNFGNHPKLEPLEASATTHAFAIAAWTLMGADCALRRTDGAFTETRLRKCLPWPGDQVSAAANALVSVGLWDRTDTGFIFHDWEEYNPTKAELTEETKARTERQKRWRQKQRALKSQDFYSVDASRDASVDVGVDASTYASTNALRDASRDGLRDASVGGGIGASTKPSPVDGAPSRPVPSQFITTTTHASESEDDPRHLASLAAAALANAIKATGGIPVNVGADHRAMLDVAAYAEASRGELPLRERLAQLAAEYCAEKRTRSGTWWGEWTRNRASVGTAPVAPPKRSYGKRPTTGWQAPATHEEFEREIAEETARKAREASETAA